MTASSSVKLRSSESLLLLLRGSPYCWPNGAGDSRLAQDRPLELKHPAKPCPIWESAVTTTRVKNLSDQELLREYAEHRTEAAFTELVHRHLDLVYSSALRIVCEPQLAEEVSQSVFLALAENARDLAKHPVLLGWLHRTTQNLAANVVRQEVRRRAREQKATSMNEIVAVDDAWENLKPHVDEALGTLRDKDRDLVLLRYFQGKSAREIAAVIGTSEEAAQKRLNRAVEQLRKFMAGRSVSVGAATLGMSLSAHAVKAAPLGLAHSISKGVAEAALSQAATITIAKGLVMTTTQKAVVAASLALAVGTGVYEVHQTNRRNAQIGLASERHAQWEQEVKALRSENIGLSNALADARQRNAAVQPSFNELMRLRGEVGLLRQRLAESEQVESTAQPVDAAPVLEATLQPEVQPGVYPAAEWTDKGLGAPMNAALTWMWAVRSGEAKQYSEALGRTNILTFPIEWANGLAGIESTEFSDAGYSEEGHPVVAMNHTLKEGSTARTWLTLRKEGENWMVHRLTGYPIVVTASSLRED